MEIQQLITEMKADVLGRLGKFTDDLDGVKGRFDKLQCQVDAIDMASQDRTIGRGSGEKSFGDMVVESAEYKQFQENDFRGKGPFVISLKSGVFRIQEKSTISNAGLGNGTTGVLMPERLPGVVGLATQPLRIRDLMTTRQQTTGNSFDYPRQTTRTNAASPQVETSPKAESTYAWDSVIGTIKDIAHFVNVSRQSLSDIPWMRSTLDSELRYGLKLKEEAEILAGDGLGNHMSGLITTATAYNTSYNQSGDTKLDKLAHAQLQATLIGQDSFPPDAFIVHPTDMHTIKLIKDQASNVGNYVIGDPNGGALRFKTLWGLPVVESFSITAGTFLTGPFGTGVVLIDRMEAQVEISFEHSDFFTKNLACVLCEERIGMANQRPSGFVYGSY